MRLHKGFSFSAFIFIYFCENYRLHWLKIQIILISWVATDLRSLLPGDHGVAVGPTSFQYVSGRVSSPDTGHSLPYPAPPPPYPDPPPLQPGPTDARQSSQGSVRAAVSSVVRRRFLRRSLRCSLVVQSTSCNRQELFQLVYEKTRLNDSTYQSPQEFSP